MKVICRFYITMYADHHNLKEQLKPSQVKYQGELFKTSKPSPPC